jgi:2-isopropylmalate synthase
VECTVNGLGERAGNAALEEIVMALRVRQDLMPFKTNIKTEAITRASHLVSSVTGFVVQPNKAIVGANAFAHESGIHQDGMIKNRDTYEIMTPQSVGLARTSLRLGKLSGRNAFKSKLQELGYELGDNALNDAFERFKALADRKKDVFDEDIMALVDDEVAHAHDRVQFVALEITAGSKAAPKASIELEIDGTPAKATATGNGPVDAIFEAIKKLMPHEATLALYQVSAVTGGTDAQAEVSVRLEEQGRAVVGQGADPDTLVASARAYIHALNKLAIKRLRTAPPEPVAAAR